MTAALLLGTLLALVALGYVLYPLFLDSSAAPAERADVVRINDAGRDDPIGALREIEFDRETGKLSDSDYESLKARYTQRALAELRARDAAAARADSMVEARVATTIPVADADDRAEEFVRQMAGVDASCPDCGPRPEPGARYCSNCGRFLPGACGHCGVAITAPGAKYCSGCGGSLAA